MLMKKGEASSKTGYFGNFKVKVILFKNLTNRRQSLGSLTWHSSVILTTKDHQAEKRFNIWRTSHSASTREPSRHLTTKIWSLVLPYSSQTVLKVVMKRIYGSINIMPLADKFSSPEQRMDAILFWFISSYYNSGIQSICLLPSVLDRPTLSWQAESNNGVTRKGYR